MTSRPRAVAAARSAFTIVEAAVSIVIVAVMLTASLQVASFTVTSQARAADRQRGRLLAEALLEEIVAKAYSDPNGSAILGLEIGEIAGSRAAWDDVDDYHAYSESPPKDAAGASIPGLSGWVRSVIVEPVDPENLETVSKTETGVKRIRVSVHRGEARLAAATGVRADVP